MNRRGFLKAFAMAAVGAAVAPALAEIAPSLAPVRFVDSPALRFTGGAIRYSDLEAAYMAARNAPLQPNIGIVSPRMYKFLQSQGLIDDPIYENTFRVVTHYADRELLPIPKWVG